MFLTFSVFFISIAALLAAAKYFTQSAENIGNWIKLPSFVIGIFILGVGTSLPELISGFISVQKGYSEIVPGNIIGANISNILLITGVSVLLNRKNILLHSNYIYIDLHFLLGAFTYFFVVCYDEKINLTESIIGILIYIVYASYLTLSEKKNTLNNTNILSLSIKRFPFQSVGILILSVITIYFSANYTIESLVKMAEFLNIPNSIIALTILSLGTTLPEIAVSYTVIKAGNAQMALGNVLGSCIFNTLVIPSLISFKSEIIVPSELISFSLPFMTACGLLFYFLTQDKKISVWEGLLFLLLYLLFIIQTVVL